MGRLSYTILTPHVSCSTPHYNQTLSLNTITLIGHKFHFIPVKLVCTGTLQVGSSIIETEIQPFCTWSLLEPSWRGVWGHTRASSRSPAAPAVHILNYSCHWSRIQLHACSSFKMHWRSKTAVTSLAPSSAQNLFQNPADEPPSPRSKTTWRWSCTGSAVSLFWQYIYLLLFHIQLFPLQLKSNLTLLWTNYADWVKPVTGLLPPEI